MFLTIKSLIKILLTTVIYFALGSFFVLNGIVVVSNLLLAIGLLLCFLGFLSVLCGWHAEGKGKLINLGNKLVRIQLEPSGFIKEYENLKNSDKLIVKRPSVAVLQLVAVAYDSLDDRENALATVDEMIDIAKEKKKVFANLIKASMLFSYGRIEEAETLFNEMQKRKMDIISRSVANVILKTDRAIAMGDYKVVETYFLDKLQRGFSKYDNLGKLVANYQLGEVYEKMQDYDKASIYYKYCADFGGETAMRKSAVEKLQNII